MEALLELLAGFGIDKAQLGVIIIAGIILAAKAWLGNKKVEDALEAAHNVYAAIEKAGSKELKKLVKLSVKGSDNPKLEALDKLLTETVDPKKEVEKVPAIKRAFRRMLKGKNLGGVLLRIAARGAISNNLED